ncbi:MAG TPA: response regulator [Candidatus Acidoferrales bacterium]|nr:response regulator [Candidatus Acidoferrales bacterium]
MAIVVVEDDPSYRAGVKSILEKEGLRVLEADDGIAGYDTIREGPDVIDLVLADIQMPRLDGVSLAQLIRVLHPTLPVLLMSGSPAPPAATTASCAVLRKPFTAQALMDAVRKGMEEAAFLRQQNEPMALRHQRPGASRPELEQHWRAQVQRTKELYDRSKLRFRLILAEHDQGFTPATDGSFASHQALVHESAALRDYALSVRILHDIIKSGDRLRGTGE